MKKDEDGNEVPAEEVPPIGTMPDTIADSKVWQWAGVGFGEYETMLLHKSMKKLAVKSGMTQLKLWGKIKGTEKDYFIVEGTLDGGEPAEGEEVPAGFEARGSGVNKFVYFVSNGPIDEWTQLPDLKPKDIKNARTIKYQFSGDINKTICTNPFFFDTEKVYLRSQIARITQSTNIVPAGLHRL